MSIWPARACLQRAGRQGYDKHQLSDSSNSRNGYSSKTLISEDGPFEIDVPRDREGSFEPHLVKKQPRRFTGMDDKILFLHAQGMTTRESVAAFHWMPQPSTCVSRCFPRPNSVPCFGVLSDHQGRRQASC